ncbi:MAG: nucleotide exchange factor GrpE [Xanthobacteraceae bacterium]
MPDDNNRTTDQVSGKKPEGGAATNEAGTDDRAALAAAVDELRDKFLRAVAETENLRKRAERDVAEARAYGIANFARDVIGVADNLARALEAIPPEARAGGDDTLKALLGGVDLTGRELHKALQKHGIRPLDPKGEKFDPNFHQAMFEMPDADLPAGTVVQVMQTGYAIDDRVLRPALVVVAKGGPKAAASADNGQPDSMHGQPNASDRAS